MERVDLTKFLQLLETYRGRDRVLKALAYSTKCVAGLSKNPIATKRLDIFSGQLSACRAVLRLLDDIPMLVYVLDYGLGQKGEDESLRIAGVLGNVIDLVFYPIDHIAWAIDYKIISWTDSRWATASTVCWTLSLYLTIFKSARGLYLLTEEKLQLKDEKTEEEISRKQRTLVFNGLRAMADLAYAIHYLPKGFLWSGTLEKWQVGAFGSFSAILGLYQALSQ